MVTGGSTDHHTREQLLCAQQSVLFLWMLLHVSPGPVTLPRARKTDDQQHLEGQRGRFKCSTCLSSLYILYENYQNMLIWTILSAWLKGLDWNISTTWSFVQTFMILRGWILLTLVTFLRAPLRGWHQWNASKTIRLVYKHAKTWNIVNVTPDQYDRGITGTKFWICKQNCFMSHHQVKTKY